MRYLKKPKSDKAVEKKCPGCKDSFWVSQCEYQQFKYCSNDCKKEKTWEKVECIICNSLFEVSKADRKWNGYKYCSKDCRMVGYKKRVPWNKGKQGYLSGENSPHWRGGVTPIHHKIRTSVPYQNWRKSIFERDNYTCVTCGAKNKRLNADHIKPFAFFPELRLDINNGRTLCVDCHKETDTYARKLPLNYVSI